MTATVVLIRHASHAHLGHVLTGRTPGVGLSPQGCRQAVALATRLEASHLDLLQSSPVERAQATATALAGSHDGLAVQTVGALDEVDFGDWAGLAFADLRDDPRWHRWNDGRASAVCPNGESMVEVQQRAWAHIEQAASANPDRTIAMVSHCDVIRAVVARVLGLTLDNIHQFEIGPASLTRIVVGSWGAKLLSLNEGTHE